MFQATFIFIEYIWTVQRKSQVLHVFVLILLLSGSQQVWRQTCSLRTAQQIYEYKNT